MNSRVNVINPATKNAHAFKLSLTLFKIKKKK